MKASWRLPAVLKSPTATQFPGEEQDTDLMRSALVEFWTLAGNVAGLAVATLEAVTLATACFISVVLAGLIANPVIARARHVTAVIIRRIDAILNKVVLRSNKITNNKSINFSSHL